MGLQIVISGTASQAQADWFIDAERYILNEHAVLFGHFQALESALQDAGYSESQAEVLYGVLVANAARVLGRMLIPEE